MSDKQVENRATPRRETAVDAGEWLRGEVTLRVRRWMLVLGAIVALGLVIVAFD